jgi:hypothetical protein
MTELLKAMQEMMETKIGSLAFWMDTNQAKTDASVKEVKGEMLAKLDAHHERMLVRMDSQLEKMEACLVKVEANPEEMKSVVEHQDIPKEDAAAEVFGVLKERYGGRHLAAEHRRQLKKRT